MRQAGHFCRSLRVQPLATMKNVADIRLADKRSYDMTAGSRRTLRRAKGCSEIPSANRQSCDFDAAPPILSEAPGVGSWIVSLIHPRPMHCVHVVRQDSSAKPKVFAPPARAGNDDVWRQRPPSLSGLPAFPAHLLRRLAGRGDKFLHWLLVRRRRTDGFTQEPHVGLNLGLPALSQQLPKVFTQRGICRPSALRPEQTDPVRWVKRCCA